jgi:tetratricopeptide (TPR) repeat protein
LDPNKDLDQVKPLYAKLPELTAMDMRAKGAFAIAWLKDPNEAIRLFNLAWNADQGDVDTAIRLAHLDAYANKRADAVQVVQTTLKLHPDDTNLQALLLQLQNLSPDELKKRLASLEQDNPDPVKRNMALAMDAERAMKWADAESHLKAAEDADPSKKEVWDALFQLYLHTQQYDKIYDATGNGPSLLQKLSDANFDGAHGALYRFKIAQAKNDLDGELSIGQQLVAGMPEFAMSYYTLGQAYQAKGDFQSAIDNYETAMRKASLVEAMRSEIQCDYALNRPDDARIAIEEALRKFPGDFQFRIQKILYEMNNGDPDSADNDLDDLRKDKPNIPEVWLDQANAKLRISENKKKMGDDAEAAQFRNAAKGLLNAAIGNFPDDGRFYARLAELLQQDGDTDGGEKLLLSLESRPSYQDSAAVQVLLAQYYEKARQFDKA